MTGVKLTKLQREALEQLPDWIGCGLPAPVIGVPRRVLNRLVKRGLAEMERPNEEWPNIYASTDLGRRLLCQSRGQSQ